MPFACPKCEQPGSLEIVQSLELPPDNRSDEISVQVVECRRCGFSALAVYEESRRGALGSECYDHSGYRAAIEEIEGMKAALAACPRPHDKNCGCFSHQRLGKQDRSGRWNGLGLTTSGRFEMVYVPDKP